MSLKKLGVLCLILVLLFSGCTVKRTVKKLLQVTTVVISLEPRGCVNDGVLLPVDIIVGDEQLGASVLGIGPDAWFDDPLRDRFAGDQIHRLAISGENTRKVTVHLAEGTRRIIIFADYDQSDERSEQQVVIIPESIGFYKTYTIQLGEFKMEMLK